MFNIGTQIYVHKWVSHWSSGFVAPIATAVAYTVKPACNDHPYNKIYYLWFIQQWVLMKTEGINLLLLTISAFWNSTRWPLAA